jgi:hypothetical protein
MTGHLIHRHPLRWTYWAVTCVLLMAGLAGREEGFYLAAAVSVVQVVHFRWREGSFSAFPVQVRLAYAALLLIDIAWEPMRWHLWMMACFTLVLVLFDWCMLSRIMALMPWNRTEPLSGELLRRTFLSAPVRGSVLDTPTVRVGPGLAIPPQ